MMIKEGFIDMHQTQAMVCCLREQIASNVREWLARPRTLAELYGITQAISHHFLVFTHHVHNICKEEDDAIKRETQAMLNQLSISWKCMDTKCSPAARPVTTRFKAPLTNTVRTPTAEAVWGISLICQVTQIRTFHITPPSAARMLPFHRKQNAKKGKHKTNHASTTLAASEVDHAKASMAPINDQWKPSPAICRSSSSVSFVSVCWSRFT